MADKYSEVGSKNLLIADRLDHYAEWIYSEIKPYLKGKTFLELGSGIGTYSAKLVRRFPDRKIIISDIDRKFIKQLKADFAGKPNAQVVKLDLNNPNDFKKINGFDTGIALNVLEHIKDDADALRNVYDALNQNGRLILLVPAHQWLYCSVDRAVGHYRRYNRKSMSALVAKTGFRIKRMKFFSFFSILGWLIYGHLLKKKVMECQSIGLYNSLVPVIKPFENFFIRGRAGISLIVVLEKP